MLTKHLLPFNPFAHRLSAPVDGGEGVFMQNSIIFSIRKQRVLTSSKSLTLDRLQVNLVCTRLIAIFLKIFRKTCRFLFLFVSLSQTKPVLCGQGGSRHRWNRDHQAVCWAGLEGRFHDVIFHAQISQI